MCLTSSDGPKQKARSKSAEVSAEISVIRTEISVDRHNKEMSFWPNSTQKIFFFFQKYENFGRVNQRF